MKNLIMTISFFFIWIFVSAQDKPPIISDFGEEAMVHVKKLCAFGERSAQTKAGDKTINYLLDHFSRNDMNVRLDTFYYKSYKLPDRSIFINNRKIIIKTIYVNKAFEDSLSIESEYIKLPNKNPNKHTLANKIILTNKSNHSIIFSKYRPKAVVVIDSSRLDGLEFKNSRDITISLRGESITEWQKSYNVIATYKQQKSIDSSIIITAHWDCRNGVGADDNASGTAALLELSDYFKDKQETLNYKLIFVATGAEEKGLLGSISFILNNLSVLNNCFFNFNMDGLAQSLPSIETSNIKNKNTQQDTAENFRVFFKSPLKGSLISSPREIYFHRYYKKESVRHLINQFKKTMIELGIKYRNTPCCSGVDARTFNYVGIPYIHLSSINPNSEKNVANTPEDTYNENFIKNISLNGQIAIRLIMNYNK